MGIYKTLHLIGNAAYERKRALTIYQNRIYKETTMSMPLNQQRVYYGFVKVGWVVYSLLFPYIFELGKLLVPFFACMLRYLLVARFYNLKKLCRLPSIGGDKLRLTS